MSVLQWQGVRFEDYDAPGLTTENGVFIREDGFMAAWIKNPDGNILSLEQLADAALGVVDLAAGLQRGQVSEAHLVDQVPVGGGADE